MHNCSLKMVMKFGIIVQFLILCLWIFPSCTSKKTKIERADRENLQSFIDQFFFANGAVYTLFGEKPISEMFVFTGSEQDLMELTEEELKNAIPLDSSIVKNLEVWEKYMSTIHSPGFIFTKRPCSDPSHTIYAILNKNCVRRVLEKHFAAFESVIGKSFDISKMIEEFKDPHSVFWEKALADHYLSGLLFGYGEENIQYFLEHLKTDDAPVQFSDRYNPTAKSSDFPIPSFALSPKDTTVARYKKQRAQIQNVYQDKDPVDVTFRRMRDGAGE